ncbi:unnamed protein product [Heligmosomoides polygyrus]|uniref:HNH endonuclease n=1 Tax=Heligmosomoides polygyrus TaxID=6339 RepID=A0A183FUX4_HELPZ|nr:unnamed protein product [Heligmosomoides polygyrus]
MRVGYNQMVATEREDGGSYFSHSVANGDNCRRNLEGCYRCDNPGCTPRTRHNEAWTTLVNKQAWLWTDDVKEKVREKKRLYHVFIGDKTVYNWRNYCEAKKAAKKAVAAAKAAHYTDLSEKLETRDGERYLYRLAKARCR